MYKYDSFMMFIANPTFFMHKVQCVNKLTLY